MKKLIKNVALLDMITTTEEAVEGLTIGNVATVLVSNKTRSLLSKATIKNLASVIEVPEGAQISTFNGMYTFEGDSDQVESTYAIINGIFTVKPGVSVETFNKAFCGGVVNGMVYIPDNLPAVFSSFTVNGVINSYPADSILYDQHIVINKGFLQSLSDGAKISALKGVTIEDGNLEVLSELTVYGDTILPEKMKDAFYKVAKRYGKVIEIPDGFTYYDKALEIKPANQFSYRGKSIYTKDNVYLFEGIAQLDFRLKTTGTLIAPEDVAMALADRVEAEEFYTYNGKLIRINGVVTYNNEPGNYLIMPHAELIIPEDADLSAIENIFLQGDIAVDQDSQVQILNDKVLLNQGVIFCKKDEDHDEEDEDETDNEYDIIIGNAATYKL